MQEVKTETEVLLARISKIVENLMQKDTSYQHYLDKNKIIPLLFRYYSEKFSLAELAAKSDFKLTGFIEADMMTQLLIEGEYEQTEVIQRLSPIFDNLFQHNSLFAERLDKQEMIYLEANLLMRKFSFEQIQAISDDDLKSRIEGILIIEAVAGTLNDLTAEEIEKFDAAVAGR